MICSMMITNKFSYILCYYDETSFESASFAGVKYYSNEYEKPGEQSYL